MDHSRGRVNRTRPRDAQRRGMFGVAVDQVQRSIETGRSSGESSSGRALGRDPGGELGDRHRAELALLVGADGDRAGLLLAVADDEHVGVAAELGVADLLPDRLRALVDRDPDPRLAELGGDPPRVLERGGRRPAGSPPGPAPARPGSGRRGARSGSRRSAPSSRAGRGGSSPAAAARRRRRCR